ncbi:MAG: hypothetical protein AAFY56_17955, partial [Pseudomonadota bacterium]
MILKQNICALKFCRRAIVLRCSVSIFFSDELFSHWNAPTALGGFPQQRRTGLMLENLERWLDVASVPMLVAGLMAVALIASAQSSAANIPENARAKAYGDGWECEAGFREREGACAAISIPENAYPTGRPYGSGWECRRGFSEYEGACGAIEVPANGFLNASGVNWDCFRGYRK